MTGTMAAYAIATAGAWLVCYLLVTRWENRARDRRSSRYSSAPDGGSYSSGTGWDVAGWFGGGHHSGIDSSGNPIDSGVGDSVGGGDSGGGEGGGGGGDGGGGD
jgi:hypothetical protein